jgi:phosphonate transport system substrate-binding protein
MTRAAQLRVAVGVALVLAVACGGSFDRRVQQTLDGDPLATYAGGFDPLRADAGPLGAPAVELGRPLVFVVSPFYRDVPAADGHAALASWLSARIGVPVEIQAPDAYAHESLALGLANGSIDVAELSPYAYVLIEERGLGVVPLATTVAHGSSSYAAYIVARRGNGVRAVEDLRGRRVAFVDRFSTSGYLLPLALLERRGLKPDRDFALTLAGSHPAALALVRDGGADAAAVASDILIGNSGLAGPLRVIAKAGRIPYDVVVARRDLDPALAARVRAALLALSIHDEQGRAALKAFAAVDGFMPVPAGHYDEVRALVRAPATSPANP